MKVLLVTLNAKFIHSSLALAYLKTFCHDSRWTIEVKEYTINDHQPNILADIFLCQPDIVCFSCYIWNIRYILDLSRNLKSVAPQTTIVLGGPEVSYDAEEILSINSGIDIIIRGEGEVTLRELLTSLCEERDLYEVNGLTFREGKKIICNPDRPLIDNLDIISFPYQNELPNYKNKIIYYETSRGCPFNCSYCLSSNAKRVRFFSLARVKKDLRFLINQKVPEIKFVDRTFNCNEKRAMEIIEFIVNLQGNTRFHLEICADILTPAFMEYLCTVPAGLIDFEIGVQSTYPKALAAVNRVTNWDKLSTNVKTLRKKNNIHLHLDLIAGLPYESYEKFATSFNNVFALNPHVIQLGFLKLLKGSLLREQCHKHEYIFDHQPPYQVLANKYLSYEELISLAHIEDLLEKYFNSAIVTHSLNYIIEKIYNANAFAFFSEYADYWESQKLWGVGHKREKLYTYLLNFINEYYNRHLPVVNELIKYDFLLNNKNRNLPEGIVSYNPENSRSVLYALLKEDFVLEKYLGDYRDKTIREIIRRVHLEYFKYDPRDLTELSKPLPVLFVYSYQKNIQNVFFLEHC